MGKYTVIDHTYDAIVVGAGGAGLRVSFFKDLMIHFRQHLGWLRLDSELHVFQNYSPPDLTPLLHR